MHDADILCVKTAVYTKLYLLLKKQNNIKIHVD